MNIALRHKDGLKDGFKNYLIAAVMLAVIAAAIWLTELPQTPLLIYSALALVMIAYLQTFVSFAYDIRKAGDVSLK